MVHLNFGINAYTYAAPTASSAAMNMMPTNRLILLQQVGFGYWVHPNVRLQLTLQFTESVTGLPATASPLTLLGAIPWVVYTNGMFFAGAGPLIAVRAYGQWQPDLGLFSAVGISVPVGEGFGVGAALQVPIMFLQRFSIAVSPAIFVAKRF
jgi:hypothetical protein